MKPDLQVVARDGMPVQPADRIFAFGVGPRGSVAIVDGKDVPVEEAFQAMTAHTHRCADYARLQLEKSLARRRMLPGDIGGCKMVDDQQRDAPGGSP